MQDSGRTSNPLLGKDVGSEVVSGIEIRGSRKANTSMYVQMKEKKNTYFANKWALCIIIHDWL